MIDTAKKYLPKSAIGYSSPKLTIHLEDGIKFIDRYSEEFDVIITDCSDYDLGRTMTIKFNTALLVLVHIDSSRPFYEQDYYEKVNKALKPNGVICSLGTAISMNIKIIYLYIHS